jgi:hypothetical protein
VADRFIRPSTGQGAAFGSNAPGAFAYLKDSRLLDKRNIQTMPTSQREWNTFILELNKWLKNETGNFDPTFTGFSSDPSSASCWYHRFGQLVHLEFIFTTGTSDDTGFTITNLPAIITPRDSQILPMIGLHDNTADIADRGSVKIGSDNVITFYSDNHAGAWTGSGTKGFGTSGQSVIYSLRNPEKL